MTDGSRKKKNQRIRDVWTWYTVNSEMVHTGGGEACKRVTNEFHGPTCGREVERERKTKRGSGNDRTEKTPYALPKKTNTEVFVKEMKKKKRNEILFFLYC